MKTSHRAPKRDMSLPVPSELRHLADEVQELGGHGTLTNTLKIALCTHLKFLRGELVDPKRIPQTA